ncbi:hypothetical protein HPP92_001966 [Vanilla planifolia]|uniref:Uncharacterized protein n=1 Tax=Vanilla planifolia TaxID=51239 RepID=A0A835VHJ7_VANPL|nr:hypothetical protein HPP92_001966 [Vanilla planifolia]
MERDEGGRRRGMVLVDGSDTLKRCYRRRHGVGIAGGEFLQECERSGDAAYAALKVVLERLQAPVTRSEARRFLAFVHRHFDSREAADACSAQYHFRMHDVLIGDFEAFELKKA